MSQAVKHVSKSSVNWQKLTEHLSTEQKAELSSLKAQNTIFSTQ